MAQAETTSRRNSSRETVIVRRKLHGLTDATGGFSCQPRRMQSGYHAVTLAVDASAPCRLGP